MTIGPLVLRGMVMRIFSNNVVACLYVKFIENFSLIHKGSTVAQW